MTPTDIYPCQNCNQMTHNVNNCDGWQCSKCGCWKVTACCKVPVQARLRKGFAIYVCTKCGNNI